MDDVIKQEFNNCFPLGNKVSQSQRIQMKMFNNLFCLLTIEPKTHGGNQIHDHRISFNRQ
jgi:hypothetical protein